MKPIQKPETYLLEHDLVSKILLITAPELQPIFDQSIKVGQLYFSQQSGIMYMIQPQNMANVYSSKPFEASAEFREICAILDKFFKQHIEQSNDFTHDLAMLKSILERNTKKYKYSAIQNLSDAKNNMAMLKLMADATIQLLDDDKSTSHFRLGSKTLEYRITDTEEQLFRNTTVN